MLEEFYLEGKSTREIAAGHGLSDRAVEGRLRRARQNLEKRLRPYIRATEPGPDATTESVAVLELTGGGKRHA